MVGWKPFDSMKPSLGHHALTELERMGRLGVEFDDAPAYHEDEVDWAFGSGQRQLSIVTQNVDGFHRRSGTQHLLEIHGRSDQLKCMSCGAMHDRRSFHQSLEEKNRDWLEQAMQNPIDLRADGDAEVQGNYEDLEIPACSKCGGFLKPNVVFFGDSVPSHRVATVRAAVDACDGLLVVGSSLAVHSAYRHVREASKQGIPIAILNVGETRAEKEGLDVLKVEAPAGRTLAAVASALAPSTR